MKKELKKFTNVKISLHTEFSSTKSLILSKEKNDFYHTTNLIKNDLFDSFRQFILSFKDKYPNVQFIYQDEYLNSIDVDVDFDFNSHEFEHYQIKVFRCFYDIQNFPSLEDRIRLYRLWKDKFTIENAISIFETYLNERNHLN